MTRIILRALNGPGLILLTAFGVAVQTSLFGRWPLSYFQPDVVLILVLWCAFQRGFLEGGVLTFLFAEIAEIHSSVPQGTFFISYMSVYLLVRGAAQLLVIRDLSSYVTVAVCSSVFFKLANVTILQLLAPTLEVWRNMIYLLFLGAAVEGLAAFWVFRWLEQYDLRTFRAKRNGESADEEDFQLQSEGF
ncbi:MAG: hypothetical protein A2X94_17070 [Bdellovibrionales bacterium GWB1_55_8]|nr:MAG: hypothetical protein A2X94_17070 [Bdellovibrionales bacterium GWB1_55_8]